MQSPEEDTHAWSNEELHQERGASPTPAARPPAEQEPAEQDADREAVPPSPPPPPTVVVHCAPGLPQVIGTSTTDISLQWSPVACSVVSQVQTSLEYQLNYHLEMQPVDDKSALLPEGWIVQYQGTASFVQVKGLRPGRSYAARVSAVPLVTNTPGALVVASPPSGTQVVHTLACAPLGQPAPQLASRMKKELKFKWGEPQETGGRPLQYVLEMRPAPEGWQGPPTTADGFTQAYRGPQRSHLARHLLPGGQYCARVKAVNCEGESCWSPVLQCCTQATVPSWAPTDAPFVWDTAATSVMLGWPEPASNGGSITGYEVEMDDGGGFRHVARSSGRQCAVQGLRSGIPYRFRVRAENEAGRSLWGPVGEGRTAAVPPGPCSAPAILGTSQTSLTVRWEGPHDDGGSPVLYHQLELRPRCAAARRGLPDDWAVHYQGPEQACTVGGLRPGSSYMARVAAVSQAGAGAFGPAAILQTAASSPERPGTPSATSRQQTELSVCWAPPEHDGGSHLTAYRLEACCLGPLEELRGGGSGKGKAKLTPDFQLAYLGPERGTVLTDLDPGHRYALRCSAMNERGSSGWGHTCQLDTLPGPPLPVHTLQLAGAASTSLRLHWDQPYGRGAPVSGYVLEVAAGSPAHSPAAPQPLQQPELDQGGQPPPANGTHLANGVGGQQAAAEQEAEQDKGEQEAQAANDVAAAGAPQADTAAWQAVYRGPDTACTVSGLEPHTCYRLRVRALNAVGASLSEALTASTLPAPPSSPTALQQQQAAPSGLRLCWLPPAADHGAAISGYQLECARSVGRGTSATTQAWRLAAQTEAGQLEAEVEGLEAGSRYLSRVRAGNACGWGPWSPSLPCCTAPDRPAAPQGLAAKAVGTAVRASWEAAEDRGAPVQAYELEVAGSGGTSPPDFALVYRGEAAAQRVQGLQPNSSYQLRVRAVNAVGAGPYSEAVAVRTSKAPPLPPSAVCARAADSGSATSIEVSWQAPQQGAAEAACISFQVEAAPSPLKLTCGGRATQAVLTGLQPGATYAVRVRGVGADGAGHGPWSEPVAVSLRAPSPPPAGPPVPQHRGEAAPPSGAGEAASKGVKRRGERNGGGQQTRSLTAVVKTAVAKAPRKRGPLTGVYRYLVRQLGGAANVNLVFGAFVCLLAVLVMLYPARS